MGGRWHVGYRGHHGQGRLVEGFQGQTSLGRAEYEEAAFHDYEEMTGCDQTVNHLALSRPLAGD